MSRQLIDGVWVLVCDWTDPDTGQPCDLGIDEDGQPNGRPRMTIDPDAGRSPEKHYQCGRHHGMVKQEEKPEFRLPDDHKLNQEVLRPGTEMEGRSVEEVSEDD